MTRTLTLSITLLLGATLATAQPSPGGLTLDAAIAEALAASHRLAEIGARGDAAEATVALRAAANAPLVSAVAGYTRTNHVDEFGVPQPDGRLRIIYPDIPDNYRTRLDLQWPVYSGGRSNALERAAEAERTAVAADLETARADLRLEVARAYWAVVTAGESARVVDEALARAEAHLADIRARDAAGLVSPHEVAAVDAHRSRQRMLLIEARNLHLSAQAALARLLGRPVDQPLQLSEPLAHPRVQAPDLAIAADRPERAALLARLSAADSRVAAAEAGRKPTVSLGGGLDYASPNPRLFPRQDAWKTSWDVSVQASWLLWDGGRTRAESAQASALASAERARLAELDSLVQTEVRQRTLDLASSGAAVEAATDALASAEEARRVVANRFDAGVATSTDVLDAQLAQLQAELDRTRALANVRLAEARLARALGR
ncbi:MAG: TolC family protein [Vicinamibacterales bacterium]|nr:TolC family protein [Vicinamibacterales bacterium]